MPKIGLTGHARGQHANSKKNLKGGVKGNRGRSTDVRADQTFARKLVNRPKYQRNLAKAFDDMKAAPQLQQTMWDRAYGKVKEHIEIVPEPSVVIIHKRRNEGD